MHPKKQATSDDKIRSTIEGKFGQAKRRFSLTRVRTKLSDTSGTAIAITFLVMNLSTWLRGVFCAFLCQEPKTAPVHRSAIILTYSYWHGKQYQLILAPALNQSLILLLRSPTFSASPNYYIIVYTNKSSLAINPK